ncbi:MAG: hypothetical protein VX227_05690 [Nitrospinota bacterium]|nr:hypothetical protein [Nitrospinota bacterium]
MILNLATIRKMMHGESMEDENFLCMYAHYILHSDPSPLTKKF